MLLRLILLMTVVPILDMIVVIEVHAWISQTWGSTNAFIITFGSIILTGIVGANLAKSQGFQVVSQAQKASARGEMPTDALVGGVLVLVGGALLLTPGYITDTIGFSFLIPWTRELYLSAFKAWFKKKLESGEFVVMNQNSRFGQQSGPSSSGFYMHMSSSQQRPRSSDDVIDVEAEDLSQNQKS